MAGSDLCPRCGHNNDSRAPIRTLFDAVLGRLHQERCAHLDTDNPRWFWWQSPCPCKNIFHSTRSTIGIQ